MAACEHLSILEDELARRGVAETVRRKPELEPPWPQFEEWAWFACTFEPEVVRARLALPDCVSIWDEFDYHFGGELGFTCALCSYGVMGVHPQKRAHDLQFAPPAVEIYR